MLNFSLRALIPGSLMLGSLMLSGCGGGGGSHPSVPRAVPTAAANSTPTPATSATPGTTPGATPNVTPAATPGATPGSDSATNSGAPAAGSAAGDSKGGATPTPAAPVYSGPSAPALTELPRAATSDFALNSLFSEGAVLQRDRVQKVWGRAAPGELVTVNLRGRSAQTRAASDGRWLANLGSFGAGGPYSLSVAHENGATVTRGDLYFGDVWLCSGQSNMAMTFGWNVKDKFAEVAAANYPRIRLLNVPLKTASAPQDNLDARWQVCSPATVGNFSAAAYFFGRALHQRLGVPIGLINASWSSTPAEAWVSAPGLENEGEFRGALNATPGLGDLNRLNRWWLDNDIGTRENWSRTNLDDGAWKTTSLPGPWLAAGDNQSAGVVWLRRVVEVPASAAGHDLKLNLGNTGGNDTAFWNGSLVGQSAPGASARVYLVPGARVYAGPNLLSLRVRSAGGMGSISGNLSARSADANGEISLSGTWKYRVSATLAQAASFPAPTALYAPPSNRVSAIYNGVIAPLQPFALRGVIWYQGEASVSKGAQYQRLLPALIGDWRGGFEIAGLPFYIAQLASYGTPDQTPTDGEWANLQWAQARVAASVPNTGLAVLNDVGEPLEIHPPNKQAVGQRLALLALAGTYGVNVQSSGPSLQSWRREGNTIRLTFADADGLRLQGDADHVFALSSGGQFYWATPRIEGSDIILSAPNISAPTAARFAWSGTPRATLYNGAGLPASLFATDK